MVVFSSEGEARQIEGKEGRVIQEDRMSETQEEMPQKLLYACLSSPSLTHYLSAEAVKRLRPTNIGAW